MRARGAAVAVVIAGVAVAACGGGGGPAATKTTNTTSSGGSTTRSFNGRGSGDFCGFARKAEAAFNPGAPSSPNPSQTKQFYQDLRTALDHAASIVPAELKADFDTVVKAYDRFVDALASANYDFTKLSPTALQGLSSPEIAAAASHLAQYSQQVCGITTTSTT